MSSLIDISPVITPEIAVWPGDVPYSRQVALDMQEGANLTLSSMTTTFHVGAHADGPNHYSVDGVGIGERPLDLYFGPCEVMTVTVPKGERIRPEDLPREVNAPRLLLRTGTFPDPNHFNEDFASLSADLVDHLAARNVRLVGIDTPSVDLFADKALESHRVIAKHQMAVLEGLILSHVKDGPYTLIALPLRLQGADASPVRAALIDAD
jgi:arylformamidase